MHASVSNPNACEIALRRYQAVQLLLPGVCHEGGRFQGHLYLKVLEDLQWQLIQTQSQVAGLEAQRKNSEL